MITADLQDLTDAVFFSKRVAFANELNLQSMLFGYPFCVAPNIITQTLGKLRESEDADIVGV